MKIVAHDRQSLPDIAIIALGSAAGVFRLAVRNGISVTSRLYDGQVIEYSPCDIVCEPVRAAYAAARLSPACEYTTEEYSDLLALTDPARRFRFDRDLSDVTIADRIDQIIDSLDNGLEVIPDSGIYLTNVFDKTFSTEFS